MNLLTIEDLHTKFKLSTSWIYEKVENKEIPHIRLGTGPKAPIRFREQDIEAWIESLKIGAVVRPWRKLKLVKKIQQAGVRRE